MSLLDEVDDLYEMAVTQPHALNDQAVADWAESVAAGYPMDREGAKYVRRCISAARKLSSFWGDRDPGEIIPDEWRSRVDMALGARAWRPQLDLARRVLESVPSEDVYVRASELFRIVNGSPFLDGMSYDEWRETRQIFE